jgi:iron(III) transport system permease protein
LLYGPGTETLAVVVLSSADLGRIGVTAALSVIVTVVVVVPGGALWMLGRRSRHG